MKRAAPENIKEYVAQRVIEYLEKRDVELHTLKTNYKLTRIHLSRRTVAECQSGANHIPFQSKGHCAQCDDFTHCGVPGCKPCVCIGCDQIFCHDHVTPGRFGILSMDELYCEACFDELSQASSDSEEEEEENS